MLVEHSSSQGAIAEQPRAIESLGHQSVRLFRRDMRGAVMATYRSGASLSPLGLINTTLNAMCGLRPQQAELIRQYSSDVYLHVVEAEALVRKEPFHRFFRRDRMPSIDLMTVMTANDLNFMVEEMIASHEQVRVDNDSVDLSQKFGVDAAVSYEVYAGLASQDAAPVVFMSKDIPVIADGQRSQSIAESVMGILSHVDRSPDSNRVESVIFTPAEDIGGGEFNPQTKHILIGTYNGSATYTQRDIFHAIWVAFHEIRHSEQFDRGLSSYSSVFNEYDAYEDSFRAMRYFPESSRFIEGIDSLSDDDFGLILSLSASNYISFRAALRNSDPRVSLFVDHNIRMQERKSDAIAANIHEDIFPR